MADTEWGACQSHADIHQLRMDPDPCIGWHRVIDLNVDLPRGEDGFVRTSAEFGHSVLVKVTYYTEADGSRVDPDLAALPCTLHGPFLNEDEAQEWINGYPDGDTDVEDFVTIPLNNVR